MSKSILTDDYIHCFLCGQLAEAMHHIFFGTALRKISEIFGFKVPLCNRCHNMSKDSVHLDPKRVKDLELKRACQAKFEETHSHEEFMNIIGRNYI
ncbi:MAG: hypothetical protein IKK97_07175 [Phascolarctobacterium sp.]|nr:hypothetical protein [Phascolarctobacterium sp.]